MWGVGWAVKEVTVDAVGVPDLILCTELLKPSIFIMKTMKKTTEHTTV